MRVALSTSKNTLSYHYTIMPNSLKLGKNNHEPSEIITCFPLVQDISLFLAFSLETSHFNKEHLCGKLIPEVP